MSEQLMFNLGLPDCKICARLDRDGFGVSCARHGRGAVFEWHTCDVCGKRFKGHNGFADGFGEVGYGVNRTVAKAAYCSGEHMSGAHEVARQRYAAKYPTT